MAKAKICAYSHSDNALPHCKCVFICCAKCPSFYLPDQETDDHYYDTCPSIHFHIYHLIGRCTKHGRRPLTDNKSCCKCQQYTNSGQSTKIYTRKELVMMETTNSSFHTSFYIPETHKLAFHIPHETNIGMNHCSDSCQTSFKLRVVGR